MVKKERKVSKENRQLIDNYLNMLYGDNKSDNTITNYRIDLEIFVDYMESKDLPILEATLEQLDGYKAWLRNAINSRGQHNSERTRARRISSLKAFYEYLCDRDYIIKDPARKLTIPKIESGQEPAYITLEEAQKLIKMTEGETHELRDKIILSLFLTTGMRLSELSGLNINSLEGTTLTIEKGKGNKTRKVNISSDLVTMIEEYLASRDFKGEALFISQKDNRMSNSVIQWTVEKYLAKAGFLTS